MTRKQAIVLILVNALISTIISVGVALLVILPAESTPPVLQTVVMLPTQVMEAPTQVAEPSDQPVGPTAQTVELTDPPAVSAAPTAAPLTYVIQPGDTLSSLALKFDVPEADIMAANQIRNADFLAAGVELIIPQGEFIPAPPTLTPIPTATDTPMPFEPPSAGLTATAAAKMRETPTTPPTSSPATGELQIEITEIHGVGDVARERVLVTNVGGQPADMQGWTLSDGDENVFVFPYVRLWPEGRVIVHTRGGEDSNVVSGLLWGKMEPVWSLGEMATLKTADGNIVASYVVGP